MKKSLLFFVLSLLVGLCSLASAVEPAVKPEKMAGCCLCPNGQGGVEFCPPPLYKGNPRPALADTSIRPPPRPLMADGSSSIPRKPQVEKPTQGCPPYCPRPLSA